MKSHNFIIIGPGPAGEKAAGHAACRGCEVAVAEKLPNPGGAGVNSGTPPSKTLPETAHNIWTGRLEQQMFA